MLVLFHRMCFDDHILRVMNCNGNCIFFAGRDVLLNKQSTVRRLSVHKSGTIIIKRKYFPSFSATKYGLVCFYFPFICGPRYKPGNVTVLPLLCERMRDQLLQEAVLKFVRLT
jgi:hypothetical protein